MPKEKLEQLLKEHRAHLVEVTYKEGDVQKIFCRSCMNDRKKGVMKARIYG